MEMFTRYNIFLPDPTVFDEHQFSKCPSLHTILTLTAAPVIKSVENIYYVSEKKPFSDNFMLDGQTKQAHPSLLHLVSSNNRLAQHTKIVDPLILADSNSSHSSSVSIIIYIIIDS